MNILTQCKRTVLVVLSLLLYAQEADAQEQSDRKWMVEFNVLYPIYPANIYDLKIGRELWESGDLRGEFLAGIHLRPEEFRDTEGDFRDISVILSYRQYLWKGLNIESYNLLSNGRLNNHVTTGEDYSSFDMVNALFIGYNLEFGKAKRLYVLTQLGFARVNYKSNPWPIYEDNTLTIEEDEGVFFNGGVQIGFKF